MGSAPYDGCEYQVAMILIRVHAYVKLLIIGVISDFCEGQTERENSRGAPRSRTAFLEISRRFKL